MKLVIDLASQTMRLHDADGTLLRRYCVSTALNGPGECKNSGCTPRGRHRIRARIGGDLPIRSVFVGRRPTGEIWSDALSAAQPARDWILSRILWLSGLEPGCNRLGEVDSMQRYIYIHGTPDSEPMGEPRSHGCVRMRNRDVVELFELVDTSTEVDIR
jgi:lipoprotein-anchoring transpeptidase ErfK/SrfK